MEQHYFNFVKLSLNLICGIIWLTGCILVCLGVLLIEIFLKDYFYIEQLIYTIAIVYLVIGVMLITFGLMGWYSVIYVNFLTAGIMTLGLVIMALFLLSFGVTGKVMQKKGYISAKMNKYVVDNFKNYEEGTLTNSTVLIDLIQTNFMCCGFNGYDEWSKHLILNPTDGHTYRSYLLRPDQLSFNLPDSCCIKNEIDCGKFYPSIKAINTRGCQEILNLFLNNLIEKNLYICFITILIISFSVFFFMYISLFVKGEYYVLPVKNNLGDINLENDENNDNLASKLNTSDREENSQIELIHS